MASNFWFEIKKIFYNYLPDLIAVNLILVFILFAVFFIIHLLKKRKRYLDDTVPYVVYLKESIEQLVDEAETLKRKLEKLKYSDKDKSNVKKPSNSEAENISIDELERLNALIDEKDSEINLLKEELIKYENLNQVKEPSKDLNFTIELLKNENKELKEKLEEVSLLGGSSSNGSESEELRKTNLNLSNKLEELKIQLSEYEIIEDDLAELKKLKEENALLKSKLLSKENINADAVKSLVDDNDELNKDEEINTSDKTPSIELNEEEILKDIEENFNEIVAEGTNSIIDEELKLKIEQEINLELEKELNELGLNEDDLNDTATNLNTPKTENNFEATEVRKDNIDKIELKKEFDTEFNIEDDIDEALSKEEANDEHSDLEFVGLPHEEDEHIEKELEKLEQELNSDEINDDKKNLNDNINSNETINQELKEEFEKFLSES